MDWTRGHTIGHGSTATVSLATSLQSGNVFAVKSAELFQSEFLQREQKILSSLNSPYIVGYRGCEITKEHNKVMYNLLLEYMSGGTLIDAVKAHGGGDGRRIEESVIGYYTCQIVKGLDYLHSSGLVHCDIKGRNILVGEKGAKIADFGCAKRIDPVEPADKISGGTPMFMAPEVARGDEQSFASDIWALGCTIIEMATGGGAPWVNVNDAVSVIYRIGFSDELPEFPCWLSEQGKDFLDKCLRRDPKERWTAKQLLTHPFLESFNSNVKQIQESNSSSNSPTSILDQGFWNSLDELEPESETSENLDHKSSASERIRRLCLVSSEGPSYDDDDDENWISIRGNCKIEDKDDVISYGSVYQESNIGGSEQFLDVNRSRLSEDSLGGCKYGKDSFLVSSDLLRFDRDKDVLLIPSISRLYLQV